MSDSGEHSSGEEAEPLVSNALPSSPRVSRESSGTRSHTGQLATNESEDITPRPKIQTWLFCSHFLSTWNSRVFEFGAVLFLAEIYPGTLLPISVYTLIRAASAICFSPAVGGYIDQKNRLNLVRGSIVGQRLAVLLSCLLFGIMTIETLSPASLKTGLLGVVCILACVEKVYSVVTLIAVERDWVVVIADSTKLDLQTLNSQMRRIDLACKLFGPLTIALLDAISTRLAIYATFGLNISSVLLEYFTIAKVWSFVSWLLGI